MTASDWNQKTIAEFNAKQGLGVGPWKDNLLLMTAKGVKSGDHITTPLVYKMDGDHYILIASKGGAPDHPKWLGNVIANPEVEVEVAQDGGIEKFKARAHVIREGAERDRLYLSQATVWPDFLEYEKRTNRVIPVVVLERV
jgi:deazaflavin-dependent oxidoreductase (nitroreductase family)